jgi:hypothetical protein
MMQEQELLSNYVETNRDEKTEFLFCERTAGNDATVLTTTKSASAPSFVESFLMQKEKEGEQTVQYCSSSSVMRSK